MVSLTAVSGNDLKEYLNLNVSLEQVQGDVISLQQELAATEIEIANIDGLIEVTSNAVLSMLPYMQHNLHTNFLLEFIFSDSSQENLIRNINASVVLTQTSGEAIEILSQELTKLAEKELELAANKTLLNQKIADYQVMISEMEFQFKEEGFEPADAEKVLAIYRKLNCDLSLDINTCLPKGTFIKPINEGYVSCEYACYRYQDSGYVHEGIDLGNRTNPTIPIYASLPGVVVSAKNSSDYGKHVITHGTYAGDGKTYTTLYAHLSEINVVEGQIINHDTIIGKMGSSGNSTAPHLHFVIAQGAYGLEYTKWGGNSCSGNDRSLIGCSVNPSSKISFPSLFD